jgi:hypothetical protein
MTMDNGRSSSAFRRSSFVTERHDPAQLEHRTAFGAVQVFASGTASCGFGDYVMYVYD